MSTRRATSGLGPRTTASCASAISTPGGPLRGRIPTAIRPPIRRWGKIRSIRLPEAAAMCCGSAATAACATTRTGTGGFSNCRGAGAAAHSRALRGPGRGAVGCERGLRGLAHRTVRERRRARRRECRTGGAGTQGAEPELLFLRLRGVRFHPLVLQSRYRRRTL